MDKITIIQTKLKAKKSCYNSYGKYHYRKCEDILEALKPLIAEHDCELTITDDVKQAGDYTFVEATVRFRQPGCPAVESKAQAGIEKAGGMALPQAFGAASSYARKYALGAMFLLDDSEDADATNTHGEGEEKPSPKSATKESVLKSLKQAGSMAKLKAAWGEIPEELKKDPEVVAAKDEAKDIISNNE